MFGDEFAIHRRSGDGDTPGIAVESSVDDEVRSFGISISAQHPQGVDPNRAGVDNSHWAPDPSRVGGDRSGGVPVQSVDDAPWTVTIDRRRDLDGQHVVIGESAERRHVEGMWNEVPLRVTEVCPVEPDIRLVVDAIELDPTSIAGFRRVKGERSAVQQRATVSCRHSGILSGPVSGHLDCGPVAIVGFETDHLTAITVADGRRFPESVE